MTVCEESQVGGASVHCSYCANPPQARFELAAVLAASHDQLWGSSGETVFQYDFMCELVSVLEEGLLMLNLSCQGEGGSGLTVLIWVLGEMRPHAGGWPGSSTVVCSLSTQ